MAAICPGRVIPGVDQQQQLRETSAQIFGSPDQSRVRLGGGSRNDYRRWGLVEIMQLSESCSSELSVWCLTVNVARAALATA